MKRKRPAGSREAHEEILHNKQPKNEYFPFEDEEVTERIPEEVEFYLEEVDSGPPAFMFNKETETIKYDKKRSFVRRFRVNRFWDSGPFAMNENSDGANSNREALSPVQDPIPNNNGSPPCDYSIVESKYCDDAQRPDNSHDPDQVVEDLPVHNVEDSLYDMNENNIKCDRQDVTEFCEEFDTFSLNLIE